MRAELVFTCSYRRQPAHPAQTCPGAWAVRVDRCLCSHRGGHRGRGHGGVWVAPSGSSPSSMKLARSTRKEARRSRSEPEPGVCCARRTHHATNVHVLLGRLAHAAAAWHAPCRSRQQGKRCQCSEARPLERRAVPPISCTRDIRRSECAVPASPADSIAIIIVGCDTPSCWRPAGRDTPRRAAPR